MSSGGEPRKLKPPAWNIHLDASYQTAPLSFPPILLDLLAEQIRRHRKPDPSIANAFPRRDALPTQSFRTGVPREHALRQLPDVERKVSAVRSAAVVGVAILIARLRYVFASPLPKRLHSREGGNHKRPALRCRSMSGQ